MVVIALTLTTSTTASVYSTVEDDGWVEGDDDSQGEISSQEELEEAYEGTQWEDNVGPNEFEEATDSDNNGGDNDKEEQGNWNESCRDSGERTGESGNAFSAATYDHCREVVGGETAYLQGFVDGCNKQKNANDEYCQLETDRSSVWGDNPPAKQSLAPGGSSSSNLGSNELVLPYSTQSEQSAGNSGGESNELPKIDSTPASAIQAPTIGNNGINETRWYNNCFSGGEGRGSVLDFDTSSYETCGDNADGDKAYYDGFVKGCMDIEDIDSANTKELCEAYVAGCLRATSVDNSETCYVADGTSSSAWKLVMTVPGWLDCETWSADLAVKLADRDYDVDKYNAEADRYNSECAEIETNYYEENL